MSEKTELPTPKKIRDAREQGQIAKSVEVTTGVQLAVLLGYFWLRGEEMIDAFRTMIDVTIANASMPLDVAMSRTLTAVVTLTLHLLAPMAIMLLLMTAGTVLLQVGPLFAPKFVQPKGERISPLSNAKQLFSLRSLFEFGKSLLKVTLLSVAFYLLLKQYLTSFQFLPLCGIECGLRVTGVMIGWLWGILVLFYIVFAIADFAFQKRSLTKQLMMSRDEIIKEYKNTEGDPHVKHKRKEIHREIQSGSMAANVKRSTALVRNPTHVAVCLYFMDGETPLPQVIEKGVDERALAMVRVAEEAGVPIVEEVYVARSLYARTEVGDYIPPELFDPVAEILTLVNEMRIAADVSDEDDASEEGEDGGVERGDDALGDTPDDADRAADAKDQGRAAANGGADTKGNVPGEM